MKTGMIIQNIKKLHQVIFIDTIHQAKAFIINQLEPIEERLTVREKYACTIFSVGSSWSPIVAVSTDFRKPNKKSKLVLIRSYKITPKSIAPS
jgi:hypothetical protein